MLSFFMVLFFVRFSIYQLRIIFSALILLNIGTGCLINEVDFKYKRIIIILALMFNSISCYECVIYNLDYVNLRFTKWDYLRINYNLSDNEQRNSLYFPNNIPRYKIFKEFTDIINQHKGKNLALATNTYILEYPIWCMLKPEINISHIMLDSATQSSNLMMLEDKNNHPDLVLYYNKETNPDGFIYNNKKYVLIWAYQNEDDKYYNHLVSLYQITN